MDNSKKYNFNFRYVNNKINMTIKLFKLNKY